MEEVIVDLSQNCRELFPVIDMTKFIGKPVRLPIGETTINVSIHEENDGSLILENTFPTQLTPQSKYYVANTIRF